MRTVRPFSMNRPSANAGLRPLALNTAPRPAVRVRPSRNVRPSGLCAHHRRNGDFPFIEFQLTIISGRPARYKRQEPVLPLLAPIGPTSRHAEMPIRPFSASRLRLCAGPAQSRPCFYVNRHSFVRSPGQPRCTTGGGRPNPGMRSRIAANSYRGTATSAMFRGHVAVGG